MLSAGLVGAIGLPARPSLNRRAILMVIFLASMLLASVGALAALSAYLVPEEPCISIGMLADFPPRDRPYFVVIDHRPVYVVNTGQELIVFDALTPYDPYRVMLKWVPSNHRYEDPLTGSKFALTGEYIEGPASRNMDRYAYQVRADGALLIQPWRIAFGQEANVVGFCYDRIEACNEDRTRCRWSCLD